MTTVVTVKAHCNPETTKVMVQVIDPQMFVAPQIHYLGDGETGEFLAYGERCINVSEVCINDVGVPNVLR